MIAGLDHMMTFMIEVPIDGFERAGSPVLVGQGVVDEHIQRFGAGLVMLPQIVQEKFEEVDPEILIVPGADAKEVSQVAGIDAIEFLGGQLGQGFATARHDEEVGQSFQVACLWGREVRPRRPMKVTMATERCTIVFMVASEYDNRLYHSYCGTPATTFLLPH